MTKWKITYIRNMLHMYYHYIPYIYIYIYIYILITSLVQLLSRMTSYTRIVEYKEAIPLYKSNMRKRKNIIYIYAYIYIHIYNYVSLYLYT